MVNKNNNEFGLRLRGGCHGLCTLACVAGGIRERESGGGAAILGSLRSYYGDADDNESRDTLESFILFITVQAIAKLNLGHGNKFEIEF